MKALKEMRITEALREDENTEKIMFSGFSFFQRISVSMAGRNTETLKKDESTETNHSVSLVLFSASVV